MKDRTKLLQSIYEEYRQHGERIRFAFQNVWTFLYRPRQIFESINHENCRPIQYGVKDLGSICNVFGCPSCWHRHYIHVLKGLNLVSPTPTMVRILEPFEYTEDFQKGFHKLNMIEWGRMIAYAMWVPENNVGKLQASVLYSTAEISFNPDPVRRISVFNNVDIEYQETRFTNKDDGVAFWRDSLQPPHFMSEKNYVEFLKTGYRPSHWLRLGRTPKSKS